MVTSPRDDRSAVLRDLCRSLARAPDLRAGLEATAWACDGVFPFYRIALALPTRPADRLHVPAAWARRPEEEILGFDFCVKGHPFQRALRASEPWVRVDPLGDEGPDSPLAHLYRGEGKAEELVVPLDLGGRKGLLVFASRERGAFGGVAGQWAADVGAVVALWVRPWAGPDAPHALKAQYETLLEGALDGIAVLMGPTIAYANASFREIFGLPEEGKLREPWPMFLAPTSREAFAEAEGSLGKRGRVLPRLEVEARGPRDQRLHLDLGLQRIQFHGDPAVLLQVHNATPRAEREQAAWDSHARVDTLLHALAHDIRGPLTTVLGFSELLAERGSELPPEQFRSALGVMARSARALRDLVEGLLEYSSLGAAKDAPRAVPLAGVWKDVAGEVEGRLLASGGTLEVGALPSVRGHRAELARVFGNLVGNALRYARPGVPPRVSVGWDEVPGGFLRFAVTDNGVGIEPERLPEVFELFRRGTGGGAGVGLSIVERVVRQHGGRVWAESRVGEGTTFYFTLPRGEEGS